MRNLGTSKGASLHEKIKVLRTKVRKRQRRHGTEVKRDKKRTGGTQGKRARRKKGNRKDNRTKGSNDQ